MAFEPVQCTMFYLCPYHAKHLILIASDGFDNEKQYSEVIVTMPAGMHGVFFSGELQQQPLIVIPSFVEACFSLISVAKKLSSTYKSKT